MMSSQDVQEESYMGLCFAPLKEPKDGGSRGGEARKPTVEELSATMGKMAKNIAAASMPAATFEGSVPALPDRLMHSRMPTSTVSMDAAEASCTTIRGLPQSMFRAAARRHESTANVRGGLDDARAAAHEAQTGGSASNKANNSSHEWPPPFPRRPNGAAAQREGGEEAEGEDQGGDAGLAHLTELLSLWWNGSKENVPNDPVGDLATFLASERRRMGAWSPEPGKRGAGSRATTPGGRSSKLGSTLRTPSPTATATTSLGATTDVSSMLAPIDASLGQVKGEEKEEEEEGEDVRAIYERFADEDGRCRLGHIELEDAIESETRRVQELSGNQSLRRGASLLLLLKLRAANDAPVSFERFSRCVEGLPKRSLLLPTLVHMQVWQDSRSISASRKKTIKLLLESLGVSDPIVDSFDALASSLATRVDGSEGSVRGWAEGLSELSMAQDKDIASALEGANKQVLQRLKLMKETLKRERQVFVSRATSAGSMGRGTYMCPLDEGAASIRSMG